MSSAAIDPARSPAAGQPRLQPSRRPSRLFESAASSPHGAAASRPTDTGSGATQSVRRSAPGAYRPKMLSTAAKRLGARSRTVTPVTPAATAPAGPRRASQGPRSTATIPTKATTPVPKTAVKYQSVGGWLVANAGSGNSFAAEKPIANGIAAATARSTSGTHARRRAKPTAPARKTSGSTNAPDEERPMPATAAPKIRTAFRRSRPASQLVM